MFQNNVVPNGTKAFPETACNGNRPMTPTGTPDRNGEITALFALIQRDQELQHTLELCQQGNRIRIRQDIGTDTGIITGKRLEFWDKKGIFQEANIKQQIDIIRNAKLIPECQQCHRQPPRGGAQAGVPTGRRMMKRVWPGRDCTSIVPLCCLITR